MGKGKTIAGILAIGIIGAVAAACAAGKSKCKTKHLIDDTCSDGEKEQGARGKMPSDGGVMGQAVRSETP